jgi:hypothetical protein
MRQLPAHQKHAAPALAPYPAPELKSKRSAFYPEKQFINITRVKHQAARGG